MKFRKFRTHESFVEGAAGLLREQMEARDTRPRGLVLAGGRTPLPIYKELAAARVLAPASVSILLSDERMVAFDSPESNFAALMPAMKALGVKEPNLLGVRTALPLDEAAARYHRDIERFLASGARLTLGLLGLGADGHTASLFTLDDAQPKGRYAMAVRRDMGHHRVSVTADLLGRIEHIVFLAAGPAKAAIVERMRSSPEDLAAGRAVAAAQDVELWFAERER